MHCGLFMHDILFMLSSDFSFQFTVLSDDDCLNEDDQLYSVHNAPEIPEPSPPSPQPASAPVMRQRAVAHVLPNSQSLCPTFSAK